MLFVKMNVISMIFLYVLLYLNLIGRPYPIISGILKINNVCRSKRKPIKYSRISSLLLNSTKLSALKMYRSHLLNDRRSNMIHNRISIIAHELTSL